VVRKLNLSHLDMVGMYVIMVTFRTTIALLPSIIIGSYELSPVLGHLGGRELMVKPT